jgi:HAD superfamily hydrolase (TIGR01549 family)
MKKPQWISEIEALGWDLDGTLYRSFPTSKSPIPKMIRKKQLAAVANKMGWELERTKREYKKRYLKLGSNTKTMISFGIDGIEFFTSFWDEIDLKQYIKKDERVIQLFEALGSKRHFLISNSNRIDQVKKKLGLIGLKPEVFELIVSTVDLRAVKADPKPFLVALERLDLKPEQVMFVGDRVSTDIMGARGVGMRTCIVWGNADEADVSLRNVYEVGTLFGIKA